MSASVWEDFRLKAMKTGREGMPGAKYMARYNLAVLLLKLNSGASATKWA